MTLSSTLRPDRGFHFEYSTTLTLDDFKPECTVYLLFTLPPSVFVDQYELRQRGMPFALHGHTDLELPLVAVDATLSFLEIRFLPSHSGVNETYHKVAFPLHARYPRLSASQYYTVQISEPQIFRACPLADASPAQDGVFSHIPSPYVPPFDLSLWSVTFLDANSRGNFHEVQIPTGVPAHTQFVEFGTALSVIIAVLAIAHAIYATAERLHQAITLTKQE